MNRSLAIFLADDSVRAILATYETGETATKRMFKTIDPDIEVGSYIVIPTDTRHHMTVCKVVEVDVEPDMDSNDDVPWVIGVVDPVDYERLLQQERVAVDQIMAANRRKKRREMQEEMFTKDDRKALASINLGSVACEEDGKAE